ncbi:MAG: hypothetical protein IKM99_00460 [Bacteroidales bacterium]|nr:hypothetical protein [Bacteroidales bacterium]
MNQRRTNSLSRVGYVAALMIAVVFFIISYCGFLMGDDYWMKSDVSTLYDLVKYTGAFYFYSGGRLFSVACQYLFSGLLGDHRIWYAIVNTLFFVLCMLTCGKLIKDKKEGSVGVVLLFALLFWFLCPVPKNTLFWIAGSPTYMWANTLSFLFLLFYLRYQDGNFSRSGKLGLFVLAFLAASEFITAASISGAFVVYYAFNIKKLKGNAVPLVVGFIVGSLFLLLAPGNFRRAAWDHESASLLDVGNLLHHPLWEIAKYRALWLFFAVLVFGLIKNKTIVKDWVKNNSVLLLSLGWSVIACSLVFRPIKRAFFFTETLSIVLALKFLYDNFDLKGIARNVVIALLFVLFSVDSVFAIRETLRLREIHEASMKEIVESGGVVVLDQALSSHRMAYAPIYGPSTERYLTKILDLDTVCVYPYYCLDKYYDQDSPLENAYVAYDYYADDPDVPGSVVVLVIRIEEERLQAEGGHVVFTIDCYQRDEPVVFERVEPSYCVGGYGYYPFYFDRDYAENLKSVSYEFKK